MSNTPEPADQSVGAGPTSVGGQIVPPAVPTSGISAYAVNGRIGEDVQSVVDAALSVTTYTVANSVNVQLGSGGPLSGFLELRSGVPYQFTTAQASQLTTAGVTLVGPA